MAVAGMINIPCAHVGNRRAAGLRESDVSCLLVEVVLAPVLPLVGAGLRLEHQPIISSGRTGWYTWGSCGEVR